MEYQIKGEKDLLKTRLYTVKSVELILPDGTNRTYDQIDIQNAVTILPIDQEGNIYFVKQFRVGARNFLLELPAGKVEEGEDPLHTAQREIREETGMAAGEMIRLGSFYMTPGYSNEYMYCYLARELTPAPLTPDADEFLHLVKLSLGEVQQMIREKKIEDSKTLAVLMLAQSYLK